MGRRPGIALMNVLMFTFITTVFLIVGIQFSQGALKQGRKSRQETQAYNVAMAGLNHATYWLQRQSTQPVTKFDPQSNPAPDEEGEVATGEESLGLVHEFAVDASTNLWGRYEVGRSKDAPARDGIATGANSSLYTGPIEWTAEDVSRKRGEELDGMVWRVRSRGYLYERTDPSAPFSLTSPKPFKAVTLEAEVRRLAFHFRETPLYSFMDGDNSTTTHLLIAESNGSSTDGGTVIETTGAAPHYWTNTPASKIDVSDTDVQYIPSPAVGRIAMDTASDPNYVSPLLRDQLKYVFGTGDIAEVRNFADKSYTNKSEIPDEQPAMSFIYIKPDTGTITFKEGGADPTLSGGGILFVEGNLTIDGNGGLQQWTGLIFVTGNYKQVKTSTVTGAVMAGGTIEVNGDKNNDKVARLVYSPTDLDRINQQMGSYRLDRSTLRLIESASGAPSY